jgi:acetyltransferase
MAFIAEEPNASGGAETLGVARVSTDPDNIEAEFAILVRSDLKRHGLGRVLLAKLIRYCRDRGTARMTSSVLSSNASMLGLGAGFGFTTRLAERGIMEVTLDLQAREGRSFAEVTG